VRKINELSGPFIFGTGAFIADNREPARFADPDPVTGTNGCNKAFGSGHEAGLVWHVLSRGIWMIRACLAFSVCAVSLAATPVCAAPIPAGVAAFATEASQSNENAWVARQGYEEFNASGQMSQIGARRVQWSPKLSRLLKIRQEERKLQEADGGTLTQDDADHIRSELNDLEMHDW
jgi:hypothetical protein